ncbi:MAG: ThuA domain-containing protein [Acidobacteriaceae bacterium]|nr:ThuA domain-containing protein [Acidobacteriaceae bacterium]
MNSIGRTKLHSIRVAGVLALAGVSLWAQDRGRTAQVLFDAMDTNHDGTLTHSEMESAFNSWFSAWRGNGESLTRDQIAAGLSKLFPPPPAAKPGQPNTFNIAGNSTPIAVPQAAVDAMMAALPGTPGVKPLRSRNVLVLAHTGAGGFVHASIPLAAKTVEALGARGGLWTTTVTYNAADINTSNLQQYDAIFLDSTTGCFLDDKDPSVTAARRSAFIQFVRAGKGIAAIHAATDAYHTDCLAAEAAANGGPAPNFATSLLAAQLVAAAAKNDSASVNQQQWSAMAGDWYRQLETGNTGKVSQADFVKRFRSLLPPMNRRMSPEPRPVLQWPEFNKLIGGYFKFHWPDPQLIYVKIDDPNSPLTAMFHGQEFEIRDETYTFAQDSFSRRNVHVLTSIDYTKMSPEDKAKEVNPRTDRDYALSYIRREGQGRVYYEGHGHDFRVYAMTPMLEHIRAGIQYALGDLKADDRPSAQ